MKWKLSPTIKEIFSAIKEHALRVWYILTDDDLAVMTREGMEEIERQAKQKKELMNNLTDTAKKRQDGYYWVIKDQGDKYSVAQWVACMWVWGAITSLSDADFYKIDEQKLRSPSDRSELKRSLRDI